MAELGLAVAQTLFAALQCSELKDICSTWGYKSQLEDLNKTVSTINNMLVDAESKLLSKEARGYIDDLKEAVYEADDLFDEFVTLLELKKRTRSHEKVHCFFISDESQVAMFFEKVRCFFIPCIGALDIKLAESGVMSKPLARLLHTQVNNCNA